MLWPKSLNRKIKTGVKLAAYTTFKIGGPARFFFEPDSLEELQDALIFARVKGIPVFILGAGSNILACDRGVKGLVIRLTGRGFKNLGIKGIYMRAGCGLKLGQLLARAKEEGLSGLEFIAGIPGTLGGALMGNAGAWGKSIGEMVEEVSVLDYNGKPGLLKKSRLKFGYRGSNLRKYIITGAKLRLAPRRRDEIAASIKGFLRRRSLSQENNLPNAGCIFKNPENAFAGELIEACGLKGRKAGGAVISSRHANFILNRGRATSRDVLSLMRLSTGKVKKRFKLTLEPEIKIWK